MTQRRPKPTLQTAPVARLLKVDTSRLSGSVRPRIKPRGLPPALEPHLVWTTRDVVEAEQLGTEVFGRYRLTVIDERPQDFRASYYAVRLRDVTLGHLDFTTEVRLASTRTPADHLVLVPMSGSSTVQIANRPAVEATAITAVLPPPGSALTVRAGRQTPHLVIRIEAQALHAHLSRLLGRPLDRPLVFEEAFDLSSPTANRWNLAIQMLHAELFEDGSLLHQGIGAGHLEEFVMSSLLFGQASSYGTFLTRPGQGMENRVTRAAKDFIESNLAETITIGDIAAAVGVGERTLQSAFQRTLGTTPMRYLRDRRLDRARADLADAAISDDVSVTTIATRWGFGHLGRFAAEYKARFGESPSHTLRA